MIIDVEAKKFRHKLPTDPHSFVQENFIALNEHKVDKIVRLIHDAEKSPIGIKAGIKDGRLLSPFSAPFGGFHFNNETIHPSSIELFLNELNLFAQSEGIREIRITLPPDIYSPTFNAKAVSAFIRSNFRMELPELTNWVCLEAFNGVYTHPDSRTYYNQAVKKGLQFDLIEDDLTKRAIYDLMVENRSRMGRPIYMTFNDLEKTSLILPTDFFKVTTGEGELVAGAIFYRAHKEIAFAVFWGDSVNGRPFRAMDFLALHLWTYYKKLGYKYIDLGISTESGIPNEGLLRFKETHECVTSLKYCFTKKYE